MQYCYLYFFWFKLFSKHHYCHDLITEILTLPSSKLLMKKILLQIETLMIVKIVFEHAKVHFVEAWLDYKIQTTWQYSFVTISYQRAGYSTSFCFRFLDVSIESNKILTVKLVRLEFLHDIYLYIYSYIYSLNMHIFWYYEIPRHRCYQEI